MKIDYIKTIEQCIAYIEDNLIHRVSIDDILENTDYSYPHFHRFKLFLPIQSIGSLNSPGC